MGSYVAVHTPLAIQGILGRTRRLAGVFRELSQVVEVLSALLPLDAEARALEEQIVLCTADFNSLAAEDPASNEFDKKLSALDSQVSQLESAILALDAQIPMDVFREFLRATPPTNEALASYIVVLGRHLGGGDELLRLDRLQLLLTRVVNSFVTPAERKRGTRVRDLIGEVLPPPAAPAANRQSVIDFFRNATVQVLGFQTLDSLLASGFFVDVRGYKLSLRTGILDPEVMTAIIELNDATSSTIGRLATLVEGDRQRLDEYMQTVDERIRGIFKGLRVDDSELKAKFIRRQAAAAASGARAPIVLTATPAAGPTNRGLRAFRIVMVVLIVFAGGALLVQQQGQSSPKTVSAEQLKRLSPLLQDAVVGVGGNLVAQVDKSKWVLMSREERLVEAASIGKKLAENGYQTVTVLLESRVVIQIDHGQPLIVQ